MEDALKMLAVKMRGSWMNINGGIKQLLNKKRAKQTQGQTWMKKRPQRHWDGKMDSNPSHANNRESHSKKKNRKDEY